MAKTKQAAPLMKKVLMATDLTSRSDRALQRALALARDFGSEFKIVHVAKDVGISTEVIRGHDFVDILQAANDFGADLVVLGIHRHTTREMFRGTTAERVVRHGTQPVLVVRDAVVASYRRALVPVDLSTQARAAMAMAARLVPKGEVHLLHAAHRPYTALLGRESQNQLIRDERARITAELTRQVQELSAELAGDTPHFTTLLREGHVRRVIREQVATVKPDLIVVGTHGRTGIANAIIGSVAEDLLADAPVDVLAVKAI